MAGAIKIVDPQVVVNDAAVKVVPNSVSYTEGFGEQKSEIQSAGGGVVEKVDSQNVETALSSVKFSMFPTLDNINLARSLKAGAPSVIKITDGSGFSRTFTCATLNNDYDVNVGSDEQIDLEFMTQAAT